ncbi:MAG: patatin-like phospholipase family protein, partial [Holophagales bacterium]|nr:patatin-like phospholipase family protein [Holophagales bacterium]
VHWVMGDQAAPWRAPLRLARLTELTVQHVMASAALPLIFPAVRLDDGWYGDGGIRLAAPLSPALHLGADRILAVSTRYDRSQSEADLSAIQSYPPPAQILGNLMNAIFLDVLDQDVQRLERLNGVVKRLGPEERDGLKPIRLVLMRPSEDLGRLAGDLDPRLPKSLRFLVRNLGSEETRSPDFLSLLLFQPEYVGRLIEIGERDVESRLEELRSLIYDSPEE